MYNERNKFSKAQKDALAWIQITGRKPKTRDTRTVQILEERGAFERDKTGRYKATKPWLLGAHPQLAAYSQLKREGWEYLFKPYFPEDFHDDERDIESGISMRRDPEGCVIHRDGRVLLHTDRQGKSIAYGRSIEIEERKSQRLIYPPIKSEKTGEAIFQDLRKALEALVETRELVIAVGPREWALSYGTPNSNRREAGYQHLCRVAKLEDIIDELKQLADFSIERLPEYKKARLWRGE